MMLFSELDKKIKTELIEKWKKTGETQRNSFIDQVALLLTFIGSGENGRKKVVDILFRIIEKRGNLNEFWKYAKETLDKSDERERKAIEVLERYAVANIEYQTPTKQ